MSRETVNQTGQLADKYYIIQSEMRQEKTNVRKNYWVRQNYWVNCYQNYLKVSLICNSLKLKNGLLFLILYFCT